MKLEESQILYNDLTTQIIEKQKSRIALKRKLQLSNETFQKTRTVVLLPWEYNNIRDEITILSDEIDNLTEQRGVVERKMWGNNVKIKE